MAEKSPIQSGLVTVPIGTDLCDATAMLIIQHCNNDVLEIGKALVLLPNNRAIKAMTEAFVRLAKPGWLLPRLVAVGDLALDEALGPVIDPIDDEQPVTPVIPPTQRLLLLTDLVTQHRQTVGEVVTPAEAMRLARKLAGLIDELEIEEIEINDIFEEKPDGELAEHWQRAYRQLEKILPDYRASLLARSQIGPSERRNILLARLTSRLKASTPDGIVIAAGITTSAKAVARLLRQVALLPKGLVVLPAIDLGMADEQWAALGPHEDLGDGSVQKRNQETHPQFHLKLLLERMGFPRADVDILDAVPGSSAAVTDIFCLPNDTAGWRDLPAARKRLPHISLLEGSDSAEEARAIAISIRGALEEPEQRIALITPDRELAVRVAAQLKRWGIMVDDSAGTPLAQTPHGTLILALAKAYGDRFSPISLLAIAKHPLVRFGEGRIDWLDHARNLDLVLRGPPTGFGLSAITRRLQELKPEQANREPLIEWWNEYRSILSPLDALSGNSFTAFMTEIASIAGALTGDAIWRGATGRQLASLWEEFLGCDLSALNGNDPSAASAILTEMFGSEVVRPQYGGHPRVAIYGLLEARLQRADILIAGGLNEGTWPQMPQPDPWLSPILRRQLGLATLDRNIGLAAHDLTIALGANQVVLTRSKRDRGGPTVASRFLLRIKAYLGVQLHYAHELLNLARILDKPEKTVEFSKRPKPAPSAQQRKVDISITDFDQLKSDPFSFYAKRILGLKVREPVASDPSYAWRGTLIHDILEKWFKEDDCAPEGLMKRAGELLSDPTIDPALRVLWQPRIAQGLQWIAEETAKLKAEGREPLVAEVYGETELSGIKIKGRADRIDKLANGSLAIVDYKTGSPPKAKQVAAGFALQLGLVGLMAQRGRIEKASGTATQFEYWSLAKNKQRDFGFSETPTSKKDGDGKVAASEFVAFAIREAEEAIAKWLNGSEPFGAKLRPEYANYEDYNQLMRLQEWDGRQAIADGDEP